MFGDAAVTGAAGSVPVARNAAYSLRGLFAASKGRGYAMIESSGATALYREQDRLPGGETVAGISSEGVTLHGAQGLGRIAFERAELSSVGSPTESGEEAPGRDAEAGRTASTAPAGIEHQRRPPLSHARLKEQLLSAEPLSRARFTRVRARNGKIGLRVKWLRRDDLTDLVGLRRGDVILVVNGLPVDDPQAMGTLMETLSDSSEVVIDLERRGEMHRLVIPLSRS